MNINQLILNQIWIGWPWAKLSIEDTDRPEFHKTPSAGDLQFSGSTSEGAVPLFDDQ